MKLIDLTGQRFGRLTVVKRVMPYNLPRNASHDIRWLCKCDCGTTVIVIGTSLKKGTTKSCGCLKSELASKRLKNFWNIARKEDTVGKSL